MKVFQSAVSALVRHGSDLGVIRGVEATTQFPGPGIVIFRFALSADLSRVRIPQARSSRRADDLWRHTCFEVFLQTRGAQSYYEINFSPSLEWALYRFDSYREGMVDVDVGAAPEIVVRRSADRLELDATVRLQDLIGLEKAKHVAVGLSAVVEGDDGTLSYWALKHAAGETRFPSRGGFRARVGNVGDSPGAIVDVRSIK